MRVGIEELQGQGLHAIEHVIAHLLQGALGDDGHQSRVDEGTHDSRSENNPHHGNDADQGWHDCRKALFHARKNYAVNDLLKEDRTNGRCDSRNNDADENDKEKTLVIRPQVLEEPAERLGNAFKLMRILFFRLQCLFFFFRLQCLFFLFRLLRRHLRPPRFRSGCFACRKVRGTRRPNPEVPGACRVP